MEENNNQEQNQTQNQTQNQKPKSNKAIFIIVGILLIVIAALAGYIYFSKTTDSKNTSTNETTTSTSKKDNDEEKSNKTKNSKKDEDKKEEDKEDDDDKDEEKNKTKDEKEKDDKNTSKEDKNSTSSFGSKKDKNNTTNNSTDANATATNTTETKSTDTSLSADWKSGEFVFDGVKYKINDDYQKYVNNGWSVDLSKYGYENGYVLNKNDKTTSTVSLENSKYEKPYVNIGFINLGDEAKDVTKCQVWGISVDNSSTYHTAVDFQLPGGIKYGSTLAEIEKAYGKPSNDYDIHRSEDLKYTSYTYESNEKNTPQLRLIIYDDKGLVEFDYKQY